MFGFIMSYVIFWALPAYIAYKLIPRVQKWTGIKFKWLAFLLGCACYAIIFWLSNEVMTVPGIPDWFDIGLSIAEMVALVWVAIFLKKEKVKTTNS